MAIAARSKQKRNTPPADTRWARWPSGAIKYCNAFNSRRFVPLFVTETRTITIAIDETTTDSGWVLLGIGTAVCDAPGRYLTMTYRPIGQRQYKRVLKHKRKLEDVPRTFESLRDYMFQQQIASITFHHPEGSEFYTPVRIRASDFGLCIADAASSDDE